MAKEEAKSLNILSAKTLYRHYAPYYGTTSQNSPLCSVQFLSHSHILWFLMQQLYCISYRRSKRSCLLCQPNQLFSWRCFQSSNNLVPQYVSAASSLPF